MRTLDVLGRIGDVSFRTAEVWAVFGGMSPSVKELDGPFEQLVWGDVS